MSRATGCVSGREGCASTPICLILVNERLFRFASFRHHYGANSVAILYQNMVAALAVQQIMGFRIYWQFRTKAEAIGH